MSGGRTLGETVNFLLFNCSQGTLHNITELVEREIISVSLEPIPDKYNFFGALKHMLTQFMKKGFQDGVSILLRAIDGRDFDSKQGVCKQKLSKFRSHLCLALAEAIIGARNLLMLNEPFRLLLDDLLSDLIKRQQYFDNPEWNARLLDRCTQALHVLEHEATEDIIEALEVQAQLAARFRHTGPQPGPSGVGAGRELGSVNAESSELGVAMEEVATPLQQARGSGRVKQENAEFTGRDQERDSGSCD